MFLGTDINVSDEARNVLKMLLKSCDFDHFDLMVEVCFQKMLLNNLAGVIFILMFVMFYRVWDGDWAAEQRRIFYHLTSVQCQYQCFSTLLERQSGSDPCKSNLLTWSGSFEPNKIKGRWSNILSLRSHLQHFMFVHTFYPNKGYSSTVIWCSLIKWQHFPR